MNERCSREPVAELLARLNADTEGMESQLVGDDHTLRLLATNELDKPEMPAGLIDDVLARAIATLDAALPKIREITGVDAPALTCTTTKCSARRLTRSRVLWLDVEE